MKKQSDFKTAVKLASLWAGLVCAWIVLLALVFELAIWAQFAQPQVKV